MAKTAMRSAEVDSLDRLEDKIKRLVAMVERMKSEQARAAEDNQKLKAEIDADQSTLAERRKGWSPPPPRYTHGALAKYARLVSSASKGAVCD